MGRAAACDLATKPAARLHDFYISSQVCGFARAERRSGGVLFYCFLSCLFLSFFCHLSPLSQHQMAKWQPNPIRLLAGCRTKIIDVETGQENVMPRRLMCSVYLVLLKDANRYSKKALDRLISVHRSRFFFHFSVNVHQTPSDFAGFLQYFTTLTGPDVRLCLGHSVSQTHSSPRIPPSTSFLAHVLAGTIWTFT